MLLSWFILKGGSYTQNYGGGKVSYALFPYSYITFYKF